jgi:hypothetical protein
MDDVLMRAIEEGNIFAVVFFLSTAIALIWMLGVIVIAPFTKDKDED